MPLFERHRITGEVN